MTILVLPEPIKERAEAVKKISDPMVLKHLFLTEKNWQVRLQALVNIKDVDVLVEIASSKAELTFRKEAVDRIEDQAILFNLAQKEKEEDLQKAIILRLKGKNFLKQLKYQYIRNKSDPAVIAIINTQIESSDNAVSFIFDD